MRQRFERQLDLGQPPIEEVPIPPKSRDELPPVLRGLQWILQTPAVNEQSFQLLEQKVRGTKQETGRPGMDLWHVLVLGVVRLALDCDYDRLEYLVHYDTLLRRIMGLESHFRGEFGKGFHQKTLSENVCHVDEALLAEINAIVVKAGRPLFKKKDDEPLHAKSDTYVLETNVHFPTDLNLLWDACRKCLALLPRLAQQQDQPGWRKAHTWRKQLKTLLRVCGTIHHGGGAKKRERLDAAIRVYLQKAYTLEQKVFASLLGLRAQALSLVEQRLLAEIEYFHEMLSTHLDLIERRVLKGETIPHADKLFSLFEPHTEWINKGKVSPAVELGHKVLITTEQHGLVIDYKVMDQSSDVKETLPLADRLLARFGEGKLQSLSVDKGFSAQQDRELLELSYPRGHHAEKGAALPGRSDPRNAEDVSTLTAATQCHRIGDQCLGTPWVESLSGQRVAGLSAVRRLGDPRLQSPQNRQPAPCSPPAMPAATQASGLAPRDPAEGMMKQRETAAKN